MTKKEKVAENKEKDKDNITQDAIPNSATANEESPNPMSEGMQDASVENEESLDKTAQELAETKDRLLRLHAEFDNYRKRTQREKEDWYKYAAADLMEKLLPVLDNFDRALGSMQSQGEEYQSIVSGVEMIFRQLTDILQKEGLEPIEALGQDFDPNVHEAMQQVPVGEGQHDGQVAAELRRGYRFKDRVIRPSLVQVAKN